MERNSSIKLKSVKSELNKVVAFIENICDQHNIFNSYYGNIVTAITEAFINAVEHGNKNDSSKDVQIHFEVQNDGFAFCVSDEGEGFEINNIADPTESETMTGTGIYLMRTLSDDIEFHNNGRTACMKFLISSINKDIADARVNKYKQFIEKGINQKSEI
jgi:serine/threonine-protein kinase RsbW